MDPEFFATKGGLSMNRLICAPLFTQNILQGYLTKHTLPLIAEKCNGGHSSKMLSSNEILSDLERQDLREVINEVEKGNQIYGF